MNIISKSLNEPTSYVFNVINLTVKEVSTLTSVPMIPLTGEDITFDVQNIKTIDACGLAWFIDTLTKYRDLKFNIIITKNSIIDDALRFVGIELENLITYKMQKAI